MTNPRRSSANKNSLDSRGGAEAVDVAGGGLRLLVHLLSLQQGQSRLDLLVPAGHVGGSLRLDLRLGVVRRTVLPGGQRLVDQGLEFLGEALVLVGRLVGLELRHFHTPTEKVVNPPSHLERRGCGYIDYTRKIAHGKLFCLIFCEIPALLRSFTQPSHADDSRTHGGPLQPSRQPSRQPALQAAGPRATQPAGVRATGRQAASPPALAPARQPASPPAFAAGRVADVGRADALGRALAHARVSTPGYTPRWHARGPGRDLVGTRNKAKAAVVLSNYGCFCCGYFCCCFRSCNAALISALRLCI